MDFLVHLGSEIAFLSGVNLYFHHENVPFIVVFLDRLVEQCSNIFFYVYWISLFFNSIVISVVKFNCDLDLIVDHGISVIFFTFFYKKYT